MSQTAHTFDPTILRVVFVVLAVISVRAPWLRVRRPDFEPTTATIGDSLLTEYILPFEIASVLLLVAVIGAVVLARKEVRRP